MSVTVPPEGTRGSRFPRAIFRLLSRFGPGITDREIPVVRLLRRSD